MQLRTIAQGRQVWSAPIPWSELPLRLGAIVEAQKHQVTVENQPPPQLVVLTAMHETIESIFVPTLQMLKKTDE